MSLKNRFRMKPVGVSSFWKMGYAIRLMMDNWSNELPFLSGIIEMDEKFIGGKPRHHNGIRHKGGKATAKLSVLVTIQRQGPVNYDPSKV